ncbi:TIGR02328 family protein [Leuconostoc carnosum]|uniref:TIGR02328 family protein n=1 Tax=Leuconostoc carnosum TaxID=1252 RepID=UPI00345D9BCD
MRLWHENLIKQLPRQQLLGQHRECCALRGKGWGKPHATVNYVFDHSPFKLYQYHKLVMTEMLSCDYQPNPLWLEPLYRGKHTLPYTTLESIVPAHPLYPEHNETYLVDCLENLRQKNIFIDHVI